MKAYAHLRAKAVELRTQQRLTLGEICERLALPKTTVYHWIKDIPFTGKHRSALQTRAQRAGNQASSAKYRKLREEAYQEAWESAATVLSEQHLRDFVVLYMAEGFKRNRNRVEICNSNPSIVQLAYTQIMKLTQHKIDCRLQCHVDNNEQQLEDYWAQQLGIDAKEIKIQRKSNSGHLQGRQWRSVHGVLAVGVNDTYFRARVQAWMDYIQAEWVRVVPPRSPEIEYNAS